MSYSKESKLRPEKLNNTSCWWSDEVLPSLDSSMPRLYRDFVLISEFSELEGPLPLALVTTDSYVDLKHYNTQSFCSTTTPDSSDSKEADAVTLLKAELKRFGLETFDFNAFVLRVVSVDRNTDYEQIDEEEPSSLLEESSSIPPSAFSIPDDTQVYFTDSEYKFYAFTHHLTLFDINARGYVHPVALSYITRDPDKIMNRFEELMEKFNEVSIKMKKGNYSNFTLDLKCRLLDLNYTQQDTVTNNNTSVEKKPSLSTKAIQQALTATRLMVETLESSLIHMNNAHPPITPPSLSNTMTHPTEVISGTVSSLTKDIQPLNNDANKIISINKKPDTLIIRPPKDYQPKLIESLYPVIHFERKLRTLAQLCQEPDEKDSNMKKGHLKRPSMTDKSAHMIPLMYSIIKPSSSSKTTVNITETHHLPGTTIAGENPSSTPAVTFANAIKSRDFYLEAIQCIQTMVEYLGKSSVVLDVDEEEGLFVEPVSSALTFGRTFMLNMDNPQPREDDQSIMYYSTDNNSKESILTENTTMTNENLVELKSKRNDGDEEEEEDSSKSDTEKNEEVQDIFHPIQLAPQLLWQNELKTTHQETHLLQVLRKHQSLIVDVIFSLMTGRTVLVVGSEQNKSYIQQVVSALTVFLPGQTSNRHAIIDWFEDTITDVQLKCIKLVGIAKTRLDTSIYMEEICILDIDTKEGILSSSPVYAEGQWINQLLDRITLFTSDEAYLSYLHTAFMTISLKAFIYHHLYVCDEFELKDSLPPPPPPSLSLTASSKSGYASETSESSILSKNWSTRLFNYLKKHEDQENEQQQPSSAVSTNALLSSRRSSADSVSVKQEKKESKGKELVSVDAGTKNATDDEEDYSEENQATVTLQNIFNNSQPQDHQNKPRTIVDLFGSFTSNEPVMTAANAISTTASSAHPTITTNNILDELSRRHSISTTCSSRRGSAESSSDDESFMAHHNTHMNSDHHGSSGTLNELNFGLEDLTDFGETIHSNDSDSSDEEIKIGRSKKASVVQKKRARKGRNKQKHDGASFTDKKGRRYLQEKLKVYGDDQTIVVYLATCVL